MSPTPKILLAVVLLASAGCNHSLLTCLKDDQCPVGQVCSGGVCTGQCKPACAATETCDDGTCFPKDCLGATCDDNAFCVAGACVFHGCRKRTCLANQICANGGRCTDKNCGEQPCAQGQACTGSGTCGDPSCVGVTCPTAQQCFSGLCRDRDCEGRSCGESFCADGVHCRDCESQTCAVGTMCIADSCQSRSCASDPSSDLCDNDCSRSGHRCNSDEVCVKGACAAKNCSSQSCPESAYCQAGHCTPAACVNKTCPTLGDACAADGKCYPTSCGAVPCNEGYVCASDHCVSILCAGMVCDPGSACYGGGCFSTKRPDGTSCPVGQLWINGACRPGYSSACPKGCADGFACVDGKCASVACYGVTCADGFACFDGACYSTKDSKGNSCPTGSVWIGSACEPTYPPDGGGVICGTLTCADGWTCVSDTCVSPPCLGKTCAADQACYEGTCQSTKQPDGTDCPTGTVWVETACRPIASPEPCSETTCPLGYYCDDDVCSALCDDLAAPCPANQSCYAGVCYAQGGCPAGQVLVAGACVLPGPPPSCEGVSCDDGEGCYEGSCYPQGTCPTGQVEGPNGCVAIEPSPTPCDNPICSGICCADGNTCTNDQHCAPLDCLDGSCTPCGPTSCNKTTQACAIDHCVSLCSACPAGFACESGDEPPCIPMGCLTLDCPDGQHCVPNGAPTVGMCQPDLCPPGDDEVSTVDQVVCEPWEQCVNGACVEATCAGVVCKAQQRCLVGTCFDRCCAGQECTDHTVCVGGITLWDTCNTHRCPQGSLCAMEVCKPIHPSNKCSPTAASEPQVCDGQDNDCSGVKDDWVYLPANVKRIPTKNPTKSTDPKNPGDLYRAPCGRCDFSDPNNLTCIHSFTDGRSVYLYQGDKNPSGTPKTPRWYDSTGAKRVMSSCLQLTQPSGYLRYVTEALSVRMYATAVVACDTNERPCTGSNCYSAWVDVFYRPPHASVTLANNYGWKHLCDRRPYLDQQRIYTCKPPKGQTTVNMTDILICRRTPSAAHLAADEFFHIAVDGISVTGCSSTP